MKDKVKKVHKMLPCPSYDIERIESWLGDLGREGLLLDKKSPFGGSFLRFLPCRPQEIRYRLEPKAKGMDHNWEPPEEARNLAAECGWEFVCPFELFYIYRTIRTDAPEMNTDNLVQAESLKQMKRDLRFRVFSQIFTVCLALRWLVREPFRFVVTFGSIYAVLFVLFFFGILVSDILHLRHIIRLQKQLKEGIPADHSKDWKTGMSLRKGLRLAALLVWCLTLATIFSSCARVMGMPKTATVDYPGDPPFVTISDLYPEHTFTDGGLRDLYNYYQRSDSDLCREMIDWREFVKIHVKEGRQIGTATMIVEYYETAAPWLAQGLAQDFLRRDAQWKGIDSLDRLPDPELGLDYVFTYDNILPTMVIRHGNVMVKATLSTEEDLYRWAEEMAEMLK